MADPAIEELKRQLAELDAKLKQVKNDAPEAAQALGQVGNAAGPSATSVRSMADAFNEVRDAAGTVIEGLRSVGGYVVEASSQAQRLTQAQQQLGLSFSQAAAGAGGYVEQVQIATAAQTAAERGIRLTQQELNSLTRVAQNYARTTGREFRDVMENLVETVTEGGEELAKFDVALMRVADQAHFTANDRLAALVVRANQLTPAVRTAAEELHAMKGALDEVGQSFASGFTDGLRNITQTNSIAALLVDNLTDVKTVANALGATLASVFGTVANLATVAVTGVVNTARGIGRVVGGMVDLARNPTQARAILARMSEETQADTSVMQLGVANLMRGIRGPEERTTVEDASTLPTLAGARRDRRSRTALPAGGGSGSQSRELNLPMVGGSIFQDVSQLLDGVVVARQALDSAIQSAQGGTRVRELMDRAIEQSRSPTEGLNTLARDVGLPRLGDTRVALPDSAQLGSPVFGEGGTLEQFARTRELGRGRVDPTGEATRERIAMLRKQVDVTNELIEQNRQQIIQARLTSESEERINQLFDERRQLLDANSEAQGAMVEAMGTQSHALSDFAERMKEVALDIVGAFGESIAAALEGTKGFMEALEEQGRALMKSLIKESIVMFLKHTAQGIGKVASGNYPEAGVEFAAAGAWAAVGVAAGAGLSALGPPASPAGSRATAAKADNDRAARADSGQSGNSGPLNLTINVSGAAFTDAGVQRAVSESIREAAANGYLTPAHLGGLRG